MLQHLLSIVEGIKTREEVLLDSFDYFGLPAPGEQVSEEGSDMNTRVVSVTPPVISTAEDLAKVFDTFQNLMKVTEPTATVRLQSVSSKITSARFVHINTEEDFV